MYIRISTKLEKENKSYILEGRESFRFKKASQETKKDVNYMYFITIEVSLEVSIHEHQTRKLRKMANVHQVTSTKIKNWG